MIGRQQFTFKEHAELLVPPPLPNSTLACGDPTAPGAHTRLGWSWARLHATTVRSKSQKHTEESKNKPLCLVSAQMKGTFSTQLGSFQRDACGDVELLTDRTPSCSLASTHRLYMLKCSLSTCGKIRDCKPEVEALARVSDRGLAAMT